MRRAAALSAVLFTSGCASAPPPPKSPPAEVMPIVEAAQAPGALLYTWTQVVPGGTRHPGKTVALARVVVEGPAQPCPEILLDDLPGVEMTARPNPLPGRDNYPVTVCEHPLELPDGRPASRAQVADRLLPLPGTTPARIAVLGDTGCRDDKDQSCNDKEWPFERIAKTVARRQSPTLVVHVGDYRYREKKGCKKLCDTWKQWKQDFFEPADQLLQVAPWLMVRGNHEDCDSAKGAGRGWFYLLDPASTLLGPPPLPFCGPDSKPTYTTPYAVDVALGGDSSQRLIVLDSADAPDENPSSSEVGLYRSFLATAGEMAMPGSWMLTHRPIWAVKKQKCGETAEVINATLQQASGNRLPDGIALALAGHTHLFETVNSPGRPPVVIAGMSGVNTKSSPIKGKKTGTFETTVAGSGASIGYRDDHGFLMMAWKGSKTWEVTLSSPKGDETRTCRFDEAAFECGFPAVDPCEK